VGGYVHEVGMKYVINIHGEYCIVNGMEPNQGAEIFEKSYSAAVYELENLLFTTCFKGMIVILLCIYI